MVLCVLNQPQMELGGGAGVGGVGSGNQPSTNRKRKRKLSAPNRRQPITSYEEPKIIKLDEIESHRANSQMNQATSPLPGKRQ